VTARRATEGLLIPTAFAIAMVAVLVGLGTWQRERLAWKEGLIAALEERVAAAPVALPPPAAWAGLSAADEYRRVAAEVTFLHDKEAFVYTAGSSLRRDVSGPGYWVFTPARLAQGGTEQGGIVMVNRGFVPEARRDAATRPQGQVEGRVEITGALRWPDPVGMFIPAANPSSNQWFSRDPVGIAAAKGLSDAAPFYIEQEAPEPPGGWPKPGRLYPSLPNNHFGYMLTWYGLAAALVGVCGIFIAGRLRSRRRIAS
jgi:surfeit locus 1 family protein